jgi:hypothetical protein
MSIRREPTYLSNDVWRALWLLAKARGGQTDEQGLTKIASADEMADSILREVIKEKYPQLLEHQKAVDRMEKELIKAIGGSVNQ